MSLVAIVVLALFVSSCGDAEGTQPTAHTRPPVTSTSTTTAPATSSPSVTAPGEPDHQSDRGIAVEESDLDPADTSIGTLRWTRSTGDAESVPLGSIEVTSDGELVVFERGFVWRSTDGLDWSRDVIDGLEGLPGLFVMGSWATSSTGPFENRIYGTVDGRWQELDLPAPQIPEIPGLVWHVWKSQPVESGDTVLIPWRAVATVTWEDMYGFFDFDCGQRDPCTLPPFASFNPGRDIWSVSAPGAGGLLAELTMEVTGRTIVFSNVTAGEEVHRIVAEDTDQAEFIAEQMRLPYSSYVEGLFHTGAWVRRPDGGFDLQPVPWTRPPRSVVALPSGGFAAYQNTQEDGYTPGDHRVWTSSDGLTWVDHGRPTFLANDTHRFSVDSHGTELRAEVILNPGTMSGDETTERYTSTDGLTWRNRDVPPEIPAFTELFDTDFGTVGTGWSPPDRWRFWASVDGGSWEGISGPPGPHLSEGNGTSLAGATRDFLWLIFGDYEGTRTLWIGRFD